VLRKNIAGPLLWKFSKSFSTNGILLALADVPLELYAGESTIELLLLLLLLLHK
jgi:hypothetical protein